MVTKQNARDHEHLNLFKQYKKRLEYSNREVIKIHDKGNNKKDKKTKGSKDKALVYVVFNAGMFEAVKMNMMRILKEEHMVRLVTKPQVEFYGEATERICLDLSITVQGYEHFVKLKVHNTTCAIDVQAEKDDPKKSFTHLGEQTVGEFFAKEYIAKVVVYLQKYLNINKLNDLCRKMALDGKNQAKIQEKINVMNVKKM